MRKLLLVIVVFFPSYLFAQGNVVEFSSPKSFDELLANAMRVHKPIFIDVVATWCGPCKKMDLYTYTDSALAGFINKQFISVKVQMDSSKNDNELVRKWYQDAKMIAGRYNVTAMPTFLFLSEGGELLHRDLGYKNPAQLKVLASVAVDPERNLKGLTSKFKKGNISASELLSLAYMYKTLKNDSLANQTASFYKRVYIDNYPVDESMNHDLPRFSSEFSNLFSFSDNVIQFFYKNSAKADDIMKVRKGYAADLCRVIINREEIYNKIWPNGKAINNQPDWKKLEKNIAEKYDPQNAKKLVLGAQIKWARERQDWDNVLKYEIELVDYNGIDITEMGRFRINNLVFNVIFKYGKDEASLKKGIQYMETILKIDGSAHAQIDTYANILYKAGFKEKALEQEIKALKMAEIEKDRASVELYRDAIEKMKSGQSTWDNIE